MREILRSYLYISLLGSMRAMSASKLMDTLENFSAARKRGPAKLRDQLHGLLQPGLLGNKLRPRVQIRRATS